MSYATNYDSAIDPWSVMDKLRAQHKEEIHEVWMPLVDAYRRQVEELAQQNADMAAWINAQQEDM